MREIETLINKNRITKIKIIKEGEPIYYRINNSFATCIPIVCAFVPTVFILDKDKNIKEKLYYNYDLFKLWLNSRYYDIEECESAFYTSTEDKKVVQKPQMIFYDGKEILHKKYFKDNIELEEVKEKFKDYNFEIL